MGLGALATIVMRTEYRRQILRSQGLRGSLLPDHALVNLLVTWYEGPSFGVNFLLLSPGTGGIAGN